MNELIRRLIKKMDGIIEKPWMNVEQGRKRADGVPCGAGKLSATQLRREEINEGKNI